MSDIELRRDPAFPDPLTVHRLLREALRGIGKLPAWREHVAARSWLERIVRAPPTATVLVGGQVVIAMAESDLPSAERLGELLRAALHRMPSTSRRKQLSLQLAVLPALLLALLPKCPLCVAAYASLVGIAGLEALPRASAWLFPALAVLLAANAVLLLLRTLRQKLEPGPVVVSVIGAVTVLVSRLGVDSKAGAFAGIALLLAAAVWSAAARSRRISRSSHPAS